jgi:hypothetical protein
MHRTQASETAKYKCREIESMVLISYPPGAKTQRRTQAMRVMMDQ